MDKTELCDDYFRFERDDDDYCSDDEERITPGDFDFSGIYVHEDMEMKELAALMSAASLKKPKKEISSEDESAGYLDSNEPPICEESDDGQTPGRLKSFLTGDFNRNRLRPSRQNFDFLVVIDFECTCEDDVYDYPFEIIEFPAVLIDTHEKKIVGQFRSFVRPTINPTLSEFCTNLTGVKQADVDAAPTFVKVLENFRQWLHSYIHPWGENNRAGVMKNFAIVTDGPWDIGKFFQMECIRAEQLELKVPHTFRSYINIRRAFVFKYKKTHSLSKVNLSGMLTVLGMDFVGREHCGLDDSINVARIALRMLEDGTEFRVNEKLVKAEYADNYPTFATSSNIGITAEERDRRKLRRDLPYRIVNIYKYRFISGSYADCDSCGEEETFCDNEISKKPKDCF
ncbi:hypothetical protein QR680_015034 [Steinernema hermaphroditum]|uniref:Exonuclease domain-containing protein n=1 Tax=Steinernema hermaphroditum TaxID=289476 RepID=A0AA39M475_9BILA|nr:hypothetical protein QR680_015034 [Steinernema hermaphroditum]